MNHMNQPMSEPISGFQSELRVSPQLVILSLGAIALAAQPLGQALLEPSDQFQMRTYTLGFYALLALGWLLGRWKPSVARGFIIALLVILIWLVYDRQGVPGLRTLWVIPTGLAATLISLRAATATALGASALLFIGRDASGTGIELATTSVVLSAIWGTLGLMIAVYHPVYRTTRWSWEHYQRALRVLEETLDRKVELEQVLNDLAHANRQLALAGERLAALRLIAEEAEKTKAAFVAKVSHEFRTPLNMIIGLVGLMVDSPEVYVEQIPPAVAEDLRIVRRNCEHLSSMVDDVLALSQAEAGRLTLRRERVDFAEVIDGALAVVRPLVEKKGLYLDLVIPPDLPAVYCDRTRIRQVILNLASNAARFTDEGGITVQARQRDRHVVVSVTDTGPGIASEDAERIFEPFWQGRNTNWRDKGGSGLGLSISKQFVELHNGRIWMQSDQGVGTAFYFELPLSPPMEHVARPGHQIRDDWLWVARSSRADPSDLLSTPRVVVCDQVGDLYPALTGFTDEIEFVETTDLKEVTHELQECPAHAVLLNAASPRELWALAERARSVIPDTPIISCSVPPQVTRALKAGAVDYLIKPVTRADLQRALLAAQRPVKRVLVVDDDPDVLQLFTRVLHTCDETLEVTTASNGQQALDKLRSEPADLVLLDIMLPDLNGWQVLNAKERDEAIRDVPTVVVSARDPGEQPTASPALLTTMGEGLSLSKLLRCSLEISALLLQPDSQLDLAPG
jgi:signal transduction histidine kinase/CheY-like chemotaxis protein